MENILKIKMTMEEPSILHTLTMEQTAQLYPDLGCDVLETLASFINKFLYAYGYPRYNKQYVFLESVTEGEYDQLLDYLCMIREGNKNDGI
jgi:hypothetical protein